MAGAADRVRRPGRAAIDAAAASGTIASRGRRLPAVPQCVTNKPVRRAATPEEMSRDELLVLTGEQAARLAAQDEQITALITQVAELMEANEQLAAKLARLEHLRSRNSGNSSLPPSMDDQPGRQPPEGRDRRRKGGGRSPGKQPGAPGSHLAWSTSPDDTIPHFPAGTCGYRPRPVDVRGDRRRRQAAAVHRPADRRRVRGDPAHDLPGAQQREGLAPWWRSP